MPSQRLRGAEPWAGTARVAVLLLSDGLALLMAFLAAYMLWAAPVRGQELALYMPALPMLILLLLAFAQAGLYPGFGLGPVEVLRRYSIYTVAGFLVAAALVFALKIEDTYSRVTMALALTLSLCLLPLLRGLTLQLVRRLSWWPEPVVLVGSGRRTVLARQLLASSREFQSVGTIDTSDESPASDRSTSELLEQGTEFARSGIRIAFADLDGSRSEALLDRLMLVFPRVIIVREFDELPVEGVNVRNLGGVLGLEYGSNLLRRQSRWVKRTIDLVLAFVALILLLPLMLLAILAVKILSPGPALFWQIREGHQGRLIRVPKIRTMVRDAERRMEELLHENPELRREWKSAFKLRDDPRIIPFVGRLFRRFSIDELPQLWSVLRGEMSLVGPRPFPGYHLDALSEHSRRLRDQVRPGITGLWQVTARGQAGVEAQQTHDIYYIRNWSPWLDLYILGRTVSAVISGRGAY